MALWSWGFRVSWCMHACAGGRVPQRVCSRKLHHRRSRRARPVHGVRHVLTTQLHEDGLTNKYLRAPHNHLAPRAAGVLVGRVLGILGLRVNVLQVCAHAAGGRARHGLQVCRVRIAALPPPPPQRGPPRQCPGAAFLRACAPLATWDPAAGSSATAVPGNCSLPRAGLSHPHGGLR